MALKTVVIPQLGESVAEATLTRWLVSEGDTVQRDQTVAEVSTDKADTELPAPVSGRITRRLVAEGSTVAVETPILEIEEEAQLPAPSPQGPASKPVEPAQPSQAIGAPQPPPAAPRERAGEPRSSPLVRRIAREKGVDLSQVSGSGSGGRVTKRDILDHLATRAPPPPIRAPSPARPSPREAREPSPAQTGEYKPPEYRPLEGDQLVPFTRRRRLIAEHMAYSKRVAPHVGCMAEVDLFRVELARRATPADDRPSYLAYVARALVTAVRDYPIVNATVLADGYVIHREINLGLAVDTDEGLIVPVIRHAGELSLSGLTRAIAAAAEKARQGKLTADDLAYGTISLSNPGARGNSWGMAVIAQPQVAIVRMGEIIKRPVVVEVGGADAIAIHPTVNLVLSYDHRIVDGVPANGFLRRIKELLEAQPLAE